MLSRHVALRQATIDRHKAERDSFHARQAEERDSFLSRQKAERDSFLSRQAEERKADDDTVTTERADWFALHKRSQTSKIRVPPGRRPSWQTIADRYHTETGFVTLNDRDILSIADRCRARGVEPPDDEEIRDHLTATGARWSL